MTLYFTRYLFFIYVMSALVLSSVPSFVADARPLLPKLKSSDPLPANLFIKLAKIINPSVVNIFTSQFIQSASFNDPLFNFFFPPSPIDSFRSRPMQSLGTGFVIHPDGLILTNRHVVKRADIIKVQFMNNKKHYTARLIGQDEPTDVALLKVTTKKPLPATHLGNSSELQVGEWVAAFGNPYGQGHTVTKGIISAINRELDETKLFPFLQTDASINPGNSGGPLVNTAGEVIGINTAMITHGIGFAIPIDNIKVILKDLKTHGRVRRGLIGVRIAKHSQKKGAFIVDVIPNMSAEQAGIKKYDIITNFNHKKITTPMDLFNTVASTPVNKPVPITVLRNNKQLQFQITVRENIYRSNKNVSYKKDVSKLGLVLADGTKKLFKALNLPLLNSEHPVITKVIKGKWADKVGFQANDIILKINGYDVHTAQVAKKMIVSNRTVRFNILRYRQSSKQYITLIISIK